MQEFEALPPHEIAAKFKGLTREWFDHVSSLFDEKPQVKFGNCREQISCVYHGLRKNFCASCCTHTAGVPYVSCRSLSVDIDHHCGYRYSLPRRNSSHHMSKTILHSLHVAFNFSGAITVATHKLATSRERPGGTIASTGLSARSRPRRKRRSHAAVLGRGRAFEQHHSQLPAGTPRV